MVAVTVASAMLVIVAALTLAPRPRLRASARAGLASCMRGHWSARAGGSLDRTHHLARCAARLQPVRTDYLASAATGVLVALRISARPDAVQRR